MSAFQFSLKTAIISGEGSLTKIGSICQQYGANAFLVYDPFLKGSDTIDRVTDLLGQQNIQVTEFYDVVPNPRNTTIDRGIEICRKKGCDVVLAIGGGSAIDTAKAIALVAVNGGTCWEYTERQNETVRRPDRPGLPLIAVPTTSGTGTETTNYAVINNPSEKRKCTIITPSVFPNVALIDPQLMTTIPPSITALTGIDTFAHALESYISKNATPVSEMFSLYAIELFAGNIREAVLNGENIEARDKMALACWLAGTAITNAGVTLPHALGQPLGALTDAPHGGTLAACLPQVIEWTLPDCEEKFAKVAEIFDSKGTFPLSTAEKAAQLPKLLRALYRHLSVDVSFGKYGLKESEIDEFVALCHKGFQQDMDAHPKTCTHEDLIALVHACM